MTFRQDGPLDMRDEHRFSTLDAAFERAISPWEKPETPVTLLFSGGVDSGLLAWALRHHPGLTLITVGVRGSPDLRAAEESAALIGTRWVSSEITAPEVRELADRTRADTVDLPRTTRNVLIAFALALDRAPRTPILCGQGVDELFLGYAHFHGLGPAEAAKRSQADLRVLLERDWPRSRADRTADRTDGGRAVSTPGIRRGGGRGAYRASDVRTGTEGFFPGVGNATGIARSDRDPSEAGAPVREWRGSPRSRGGEGQSGSSISGCGPAFFVIDSSPIYPGPGPGPWRTIPPISSARSSFDTDGRTSAPCSPEAPDSLEPCGSRRRSPRPRPRSG